TSLNIALAPSGGTSQRHEAEGASGLCDYLRRFLIAQVGAPTRPAPMRADTAPCAASLAGNGSSTAMRNGTTPTTAEAPVATHALVPVCGTPGAGDASVIS